MVAVTSMSRVAGMALMSGVGIVRVVTGRVVVTLVTIVHGVVIVVVGTVLIAHTGLVSADVGNAARVGDSFG